MKLDTVIAKINKQYGDNTIGFAKNLKYTEVERLSSGSLFLDWALGQNKLTKESGWPMGRVVELYGPESSGKSLISLKTIVEAQKKGFGCAYIDCENSFDKNFAASLGVNVNDLILTRESQAEKVIDLVCNLFEQTNDIKVVVFDSLASMIPKIIEEDALEDAQMAPMARVMSKGLPKLILKNKNNALVIFINQLRMKPGVIHGNPEYTPGGNSLKYYSSLRVDVRRGDWIFADEDNKKRVGQFVKFRLTKNKSAIPQKEGYFKYLYTGVLDRVDELISLGILNGTVTRRGSYYDLGEQSYQGREQMEVALKNNAKLFERARNDVFQEKI